MFAIFIIYATLTIFVKIATLMSHFVISFEFLLTPWRMFAKFAIFTKFSISVKIATFKGNAFAIAFELLLGILANVRHICHLRQIRHFRQGRHSQRATLPSHFNFSLDFGECLPYLSFASNSPFSSRSPLSKGHFAISFQFFLILWWIFAIFIIFGKIATLLSFFDL